MTTGTMPVTMKIGVHRLTTRKIRSNGTLAQVWDVIQGLEQMPKRHILAAENAFKSYEVRRALAGNSVVLFTIDEAAGKVWVIGFRHGSRLPRPDELPGVKPEKQ